MYEWNSFPHTNQNIISALAVVIIFVFEIKVLHWDVIDNLDSVGRVQSLVIIKYYNF